MFGRTSRAALFALAGVLAGCKAPGMDWMDSLSMAQGFPGQSIPVPTLLDLQPSASNACRSGNPNHICLAAKWLVFVDPEGAPVVSREDALQSLGKINEVWGKCDLGFVLEDYVTVDPTERDIEYRISNYSDLTKIRRSYSDDSTLLVAFTGTWDRGGSLGNTGANAWTTLPGSGPYGAILEKPVAKNANLISHEIGHYLNLSHVDDSNALMNAVIYRKSVGLYDDHCKKARETAKYFWAKMIR